MLKKIILTVVLAIAFSGIFAQGDTTSAPSSPRFADRLIIGGNIGLQFGNTTFIDVSPSLGYLVKPKILMGLGFTYQYISYNDATYKFKSDIYGGRVFGRYYFFDYLFAHTEYEYLSVGRELYDPGLYYGKESGRISVESYLIGGGYRQNFGDRSGFFIILLYNLNESAFSLYQNPIIRVGVDIGL